ncbi:MAG: cysteine desulfurase NifS [Anaerolineaceae bacterium]|nr:cysteine desulfurase NifS [Anaerolineaceae bacterium]
MKPIYLDYNATTPIAPEVTESMLPYLYDYFGNPSSSHPYGVKAKSAVEQARIQVADLIGAQAQEIIFTSGGTEANNFAILGYCKKNRERGRHIITSAIEHPAVMEVCRALTEDGFSLTVLPVDKYGLVNPQDLRNAIQPDTILVSIMLANNEVGSIQPVKELTQIAHQFGICFHSDAAQAVGKVPVNVEDLGVDLLSIAGHKLYAPKGVGVLYKRDGVNLQKIMFGASHESNQRPGTENVLEIVGLGKACEIAGRDLDRNMEHYQKIRDDLHHALLEGLGEQFLQLNGHPEKRLPNTLNVSFKGVEANTLLSEIGQQVAASAGAACHADLVDVSTVLQAMGVPVEWAMGTVRFSVGRETRQQDINQVVPLICDTVVRLCSGYTSVPPVLDSK